MNVKQYTIRRPETSAEATYINVPFGQAPWLVDQRDIIDTKFVDIEVENSINAIFDYEKVRFRAKRNGNSLVDSVKYNLVIQAGTNWSSLGFNINDLSQYMKALLY